MGNPSYEELMEALENVGSQHERAKDRIADLERQLAEIKQPGSLAMWIDIAKSAEARATSLEQQLAEQVRRWKESEYVNLQIAKINAQLREALKFYGRHDTSCGWFRFPGASTKPCSCGFNEALEALAGDGGKGCSHDWLIRGSTVDEEFQMCSKCGEGRPVPVIEMEDDGGQETNDS